MNIKSILFLVVIAGVGFGAVFYWEINKKTPDHPPLVESSSSPDSITPFDHQMLTKGYVRNHDDHRWYPLWESIDDNGCTTYGGALDVTFKCRTPLTGGIPEEK
jgi:hypothetical protein